MKTVDILTDVREKGFLDIWDLWQSDDFVAVFEAWYEDDQQPWMLAAITTLLETPIPNANCTARTSNMIWGQRLYPGRESDYQIFADILLVGLSGAVLILPSETSPFNDKKKHLRNIQNICHRTKQVLLTNRRIWVSRPLDIIPVDKSQWVRKDVIEKTYSPFTGADTCIVCDAGRMSLDELELIRATPWQRYIELG